MNKVDGFIDKLKNYKSIFTKQQYKALRGQALKGELEAVIISDSAYHLYAAGYH